MDSLLADVRSALRSLRKSPGYTVIAVLCLALGIGVDTTVFSAINGMLLRPLGYRDQDRLVRLWSTSKSGWDEQLALGDVQALRARMRTVAGVAAYRARVVSLGNQGSDGALHVQGEAVTANTFRLLGIRPALGRDFLPDEEIAGRDRVVILGHDLWERRFAADRAIVGRAVTLDGEPYTVVGVMPPRMRFPGTKDLWVPVAMDEPQPHGDFSWSVFARLAPGATLAQASAESGAIAGELAKEFPQNAGVSVRAILYRDALVDDYRAVLWTMLGAVSFVLLIACGNVANLLLARATARQREIAVRVAMGASRARIVRQLLVESVLVALAAGVGGVVLSLWGLDLIRSAIPYELPFWMTFEPDLRVLSYTFGISLVTACLFTLAPALQATRPDLTATLKDGGRASTAGRERHRLRHALIVGQLALCLVLLVGATLMMRSFVNLRLVDPGYRTTGILTAQVMLPGTRYDDVTTSARTIAQLEERLGAIPGVERAAFVGRLPLGGSSTVSRFEVQDRTFPPGERPGAQSHAASGSYFQALDIPLVTGRTFTAAEQLDTAAHVLVVNRTFAERIWPGESALGKRVRWGDGEPWMTVIGVVAPIKQRRLTDEPQMQMYLPYPQFSDRTMTVILRAAAGDPASLAPALRRVVAQVDANIPVFGVATLDAVRERSTWESRLFGGMFLAFGIVALVLASIGLYGVVAYTVAQRTHEIGVRVALGAEIRDVLALVVGQGVRLALLGVGIGTVLGFGVTRALRGLLFGVSASDPLSFAAIALVLALVAVLASLLPARRASRVDPMVALRQE